jgi:hypothetical protein
MRTALLRSVSLSAFDNGGYTPTEADIAIKRANERGRPTETDPMLAYASDTGAMVEYWDKTDAIVDGIDAMRLAGPWYLPKFTDEDDADYNYRLQCTKMTNIYRDIVETLSSKPFEQECDLEVEEGHTVPEPLLDFVEDVDGSGTNLTGFASATFFNGINSAIDWIFVDYPKADPTIVRTVADQKAAGLRPYWSHVLGRNVREVRSKVINGKETLTFIRIFEPGSPAHVRIFERGGNGLVSWYLYVKTDVEHDAPANVGGGKTRYSLETDGSLDGLDQIPLVPFFTGRRDGRTFRFFPAMRDAADLQINLYQNESALEFVKRLAGYPMLAGNGVSPQKAEDGKTIKKLAVGPARVLYAPIDASGKAGSWTYVEPAATSMTFLAADIKATQEQLRELGRVPLTAQSGNLTVIAAATASAKGKSAVTAWALNLKNALENAMVITCKWLEIKTEAYDPVVSVYTDFDEFAEGKDLEVLQAARAAGDISQETYWFELGRRRVLSDEFDPETEKERLLAEVPAEGEDTSEDDLPPAKGGA